MSSTPTPGSASTSAAPERAARPDEQEVTPIGVDVGSKQPAVVATVEGMSSSLVAGDGSYGHTIYSEFCSATNRLAVAPDYTDTTLGEIVARYWSLFREAFEQVGERVVDYAREHPAPVLVIEDLESARLPLIECYCGGCRYATWAPPVIQAVLIDVATDAGIPVVTVDPFQTSQRCHECGELGELDKGELHCLNPDCSVDDVCRDRSAAVTIAKRGLTRVESEYDI